MRSILRSVSCVSFLGLALVASACFAADPASESSVDENGVLTEESYWRWQLYLQKPMIPVEQLKAVGEPSDAPIPLKGRQLVAPYERVDRNDTPPPPADWETFDYDDAGWPRTHLTNMPRSAFGRFSATSIRLRGKFFVQNPKAIQKLTLGLKFYGGVVVYLNGTEVARSFLPDGPLDRDTLAEPYPLDVQVGKNGKPIPLLRFQKKLPKDVQVDLAARVAKRWRTLDAIALPTSALRKGVNVLAIEVRRSPYPAVAKKWFARPAGTQLPSWIPISLSEIRLQVTGTGARGGFDRPDGLQVWNEDRNVAPTFTDFGDPVEPLRPSPCGRSPSKGRETVRSVVRWSSRVLERSRG